MRSFFKTILIPCITLAFSALVLQACSGDQTGSSGTNRCVPNSTQACVCEVGMGVQTCQADGTYDKCSCNNGASSSSSSGGGNGGAGGGGNCHNLPGAPMTCGNGTVDLGEECDDGNCDPTDKCNNDCKNPYCGDHVVQPPETCDGTENCPTDCGVPSSSSSSSSSSSGTTCAGQLIFAGFSSIGDTNGHFQYNGQEGLDAAKAACASVNGFGMCDYDQWKQMETDPVMHAADVTKLAMLIPTGTTKTIWLHRTTDIPGDPAGPGGRCNEWFYPTNHLADGEFVNVTNTAGVISYDYHFDPDTVYDANNPAPHDNPGIPCSTLRAVPCCFQKCVPTP